MSRQVSHRRGTRRADAYPVAELAVALALMLAFLVAPSRTTTAGPIGR